MSVSSEGRWTALRRPGGRLSGRRQTQNVIRQHWMPRRIVIPWYFQYHGSRGRSRETTRFNLRRCAARPGLHRGEPFSASSMSPGREDHLHRIEDAGLLPGAALRPSVRATRPSTIPLSQAAMDTRKSKTNSMGDRRSMRLHKCTPLTAISQTLFEIEATASPFLLETMVGKETRARAIPPAPGSRPRSALRRRLRHSHPWGHSPP